MKKKNKAGLKKAKVVAQKLAHALWQDRNEVDTAIRNYEETWKSK